MIALSAAAANAVLATLSTQVGGSATLKLYTDPRPADADTAVGSATLLATFTLHASSAFLTPSGAAMGVDLTSTITTTAVAVGTATWGRVSTSGGTTIFDGAASSDTSTAPEFLVAPSAIGSGDTVSLAAGSILIASS